MFQAEPNGVYGTAEEKGCPVDTDGACLLLRVTSSMASIRQDKFISAKRQAGLS